MRQRPHYLARILAEFAQHRYGTPPGGSFHLEISHDAWCERPDGRGPCTCDPDIRRIFGPPLTREGR